jgi:hypothetical protein
MATMSDERFGEVSESEKPVGKRPKVLDEDRFSEVWGLAPIPPNKIPYLEGRDLELTSLHYQPKIYDNKEEWIFLLNANDLSAIKKLGEFDVIAFWSGHTVIKRSLRKTLRKIRAKDPHWLVENPDTDLLIENIEFTLEIPVPVVITKDRTKKPKPGRRRPWEMVPPGEFRRRLATGRAKPLSETRMPWDREEDSEGE